MREMGGGGLAKETTRWDGYFDVPEAMRKML